ncbi:MAG: zinc-ribbon domain-containing protein [Firmicutes bacterium]|nr:zinc-ribbon domain-containing protein [Bacillota bacterium]
MIITCPTCSARFQYDDARFQGIPRKKFRCPKCSTEFHVDNPNLPPPPEPVTPPFVPPSAPPDVTSHRERNSMLTEAGIAPPMPQDMRYSLAFLSGPQASTVRVLESSRTVIGREEGDILTHDPECSRRHCRLDIHPDGSVWLVDLGSTNGTLVDGVQVFGSIQLTDRQEFVCGRSTFMLMARPIDPNALI